MGSPTSEPCRRSDEDQHQVTLTHSFEIQSTEVTQGEFSALMGYDPVWPDRRNARRPVEAVNWYEAAAYCNALSDLAGLASCYACTGSGPSVLCEEAATYAGQAIYDCPGYRLPTEAEWEYAYRAGTTTAYYSGAKDPDACYCQGDAKLDSIAWYCANANGTTHPVGQKQANAWGLYDMAGNSWEWCNDRYQASLGSSEVSNPPGFPTGFSRVIRGGSYSIFAERARAACRYPYHPADYAVDLGFRCLRTN